jgi:Putative MetA-pathway of phenol degradation
MIQLPRAAGERVGATARELCIDRKTLRRRWARSLTVQVMLAALLTIPLDVPAAARVKPDEQTLIEELKVPQDPTILKRRMWLDTEWNSFKDDSDDVELTVGRVWAWPLSAHREWAVRLKVPVKSHFAGDAVNDSSKHGLGDIRVAAGMAVRFSDSLRAGYGLDMRFPTGADRLSANVWQPQLFGAVAWDASPRITLSPSAEYNQSITEQNGAARQHFLEMFFPMTFVLPGFWSVTPSYELKVDFANSSHVTRSAKLQVNKQLGSTPLGFSFSVKKSDETDKKFQINFVSTYYFR